ncbi:MAG: hypothetical protein LBH55_02690 [Mycoplasmataceae bacterium]|jgi:hypothetical protein|nr:hypothetical protein [Mycoplasmataceae bacterium]
MIITDSKNKYVKVGDIFSVELYNPAKITIGGPEGATGNDVVDSKGREGTDEPTTKPSKRSMVKQPSLRELIMQMQNDISKIQDNMRKMDEKIDDIVKMNNLKTK